jgi:hypothetical protein
MPQTSQSDQINETLKKAFKNDSSNIDQPYGALVADYYEEKLPTQVDMLYALTRLLGERDYLENQLKTIINLWDCNGNLSGAIHNAKLLLEKISKQ